MKMSSHDNGTRQRPPTKIFTVRMTGKEENASDVTEEKRDQERPDSTNTLTRKIADLLLSLATILGLLPEGQDGIRKKTWVRKLKTRVPALITAAACFSFFPVHEYCSWETLHENSALYLSTEMAYGLLPTLAAWMTVLTFWNKRREFTSLLERCRNVVADDLNITRLTLELLFVLCYIITCSKITISFYTQTISHFWISLAEDVSFVWVLLCATSSGIFYVTLGRLLARAFAATNGKLRDVLRQGRETPPAALHQIYKQLITLRMIQDDMLAILALPLLGLATFLLYTLTVTLFHLLMQFIKGEGGTAQDTVASIALDTLTVLIFASLGYTADSIKQEASASAQLLTQEKPKNIADDAQHAWTDEPIKFAIYKLCSQPVSTRVCGFFTLSRSTFLNVLNAAATYLVILTQFRLLEDPRSFSKSGSGGELNHSLSSDVDLRGNDTGF